MRGAAEAGLRDRVEAAPTTPLGRRIASLIAAQGPIPVATFMALALADRQDGYYATRDPLGAAGDFTTAPEISQIFGELVGAALAQAWLDLGAPSPVRLVEVGPGRGTLMVDLLRAVRGVPGLAAASQVHLVETSAALEAVQRARLEPHAVHWHRSLATLPTDGPLLLVANELLDALPIRQFVATTAGWRERLVGLDDAGALVFTADPRALPPLSLPPAPLGAVVELSPAREAWIAGLAGRLVRQGGVAYLIDYGAAELTGDTLMAIARHREVDPLAAPGAADLSTHVAFAPLAASARDAGASAWGPITQGMWLQRLGIAARLERLLRRAGAAQADELHRGAQRLVEPTAMGARFKVLALTGGDPSAPSGFLAAEAGP